MAAAEPKNTRRAAFSCLLESHKTSVQNSRVLEQRLMHGFSLISILYNLYEIKSMGYRSDVVVILSDTAYAKFHMLYPDLFSNLEDLLVTRPVEEIIQSDKSRVWFLVSEHIKWYSSYDEVQQFESFLNELDSEDFKFVRIGEEYEDIEIKGELDPLDGPIYVNRHIVTPWENV